MNEWVNPCMDALLGNDMVRRELIAEKICEACGLYWPGPVHDLILEKSEFFTHRMYYHFLNLAFNGQAKELFAEMIPLRIVTEKEAVC